MNIELETLDELARVIKQLFPMRYVKRSYQDFHMHSDLELSAGIFSVIASTGNQYNHITGARMTNGLLHVFVIGQIKMPENSAGVAIEAAELAMLEQLRTLSNSTINSPLLSLNSINDWITSSQMDAPYGWLRANMSIRMRR